MNTSTAVEAGVPAEDMAVTSTKTRTLLPLSLVEAGIAGVTGEAS